jgi:uncharacterized membrane protein YeiH
VPVGNHGRVEAAELAGTVVFAISGVIAVAGRPLDWFGAMVVGVVTALGGGTIRGLILGLTPVFWVEDETFLLTAVIGSAAAIAAVRLLARASSSRFEETLQLADAAGLALFSVAGANVALDHGFDGTIAVLAGLITGVGGGVIRDLLAGRTPLILRGEIYATAALAGCLVFVGLDQLTAVSEPISAVAGAAAILVLRILGINREWSLPPLSPADG